MKSEEEMAALFPDHPEALANTLEVADKVEAYSIDRDPVLPKFDLGEEFLSHIDAYLEKYKDVMLISSALLNRVSMDDRPSRIEYCVCT